MATRWTRLRRANSTRLPLTALRQRSTWSEQVFDEGGEDPNKDMLGRLHNIGATGAETTCHNIQMVVCVSSIELQ